MKLDIKPLTPKRWPDFETVFNSRGCSMARGCWCMYYRLSGAQGSLSSGKARARARRAKFKVRVAKGPPPGLIGYRGKAPIGWVSLGPREDYAKLRRSPVLKPVDDEPVWSVICFVVPAEFRRQGVARALLDGAVAYARKHGARLIEAYPVDRPDRTRDENLWFGTKSMFDDAGFEEVARRKPRRPIVRLRSSA